jgi:hypothetical protein
MAIFSCEVISNNDANYAFFPFLYETIWCFQITMQIMHFSPFYTKQFGVIVTIKYQCSVDKSTAIVSIENSKLKAVISIMGWPF